MFLDFEKRNMGGNSKIGLKQTPKQQFKMRSTYIK